MTVTINGTTGVSLCDTNSVPTAALQASAVTQPKIGSGVAGNGPAFRAYRATSNQTLSNGVWTKVQLNTEAFDTANCFDSSTNYRFTPNVAGYYQFSGAVYTNASGGLTRYLVAIYKNGGDSSLGIDLFPYSATNAAGTVSDLTYMNGSTDYVELYVYLTGGGTLLATASQNGTYLAGSLIRAA